MTQAADKLAEALHKAAAALRKINEEVTDVSDDLDAADTVLDAYEAEKAQALPDMRAVCEALGFDPTNHHNAAKCPYCRPSGQAERVPLTDEQIDILQEEFDCYGDCDAPRIHDFARAIEHAHGIGAAQAEKKT